MTVVNTKSFKLYIHIYIYIEYIIYIHICAYIYIYIFVFVVIGGMASAIHVYSSVSAGRASLKSAAIHSLQFCWPCFLEVSSHLNVGIVILA